MAVRKIETEIALGGEKAFNDALKCSNSNLKTLRSDMAAVTSEFRKNENSTEALTAKQKILQDQYDQQKEIVNALSERLKKVAEAYGEDSAQADRMRQQLNAATIQLNKTQDALDETSDALAGTGDSAEAAGKTVANVADGMSESFSNVAKAAAAVAGVGAAIAGAVASIGVGAVKTLTGYATDAAHRSKDAYDRANELAEQAYQAALQGNEDAAMEYLRQANELIDSIDADYLRFGETLSTLDKSSTAAKDALGKILLPALQELGDEGAALLQGFADDMEAAAGDTEQMGQIMADYLQRGIELMREKLPEFGQIAIDLLEGLGAGLGENLDVMLDDVLGIVDYLLQTLEEHADELGSAAATLISKLAVFLVENIPTLLSIGGDIITQLVVGLSEALPDLLGKAPEIIGSILDGLISNAPQLLSAGAEVISQIIVGLLNAIPRLIAEIVALPGKLLNAWKEVDIDWSSIGSNIVAGISDGIANMWDTLVNWVSEACSNLLDSILSIFDIHSPSGVMRDRVGKNLAAGIGVGFEDEMDDVSRDMQQSLDDAIPEPSAYPFAASVEDAPGGGSGGKITNMGGISITVNGYNAKNDDELAETISYKLQELLERKGA